MKLRNFEYFFREGFKSFWGNGLMSVASVIIVTASLLLFGVYMVFSMNINYIGDQIMEQYEVRLFLDTDCSPERAAEIGNELTAIEHVTGVTFVTKTEALEEYRVQLGDSAEILNGLETDNPLPDSYKLTLDDLKYSQSVAEKASSIANVSEVKNNKDTVDKIDRIGSVMKNASIILMIILSLISVFIISNTIKITLFARRKDINIMKYIGATNGFISAPFVIEGIIVGLIGAIVAMAVVMPTYNYIVAKYMGSSFGSSLALYSAGEMFPSLLLGFGGIGIALGAIGSAISIRRHLNV